MCRAVADGMQLPLENRFPESGETEAVGDCGSGSSLSLRTRGDSSVILSEVLAAELWRSSGPDVLDPR